MSIIFPKDIWNLIGSRLNLRSLLSLRATCTKLNTIVIGMQSRWYKAHQWLLARNHNPGKVKCAVNVHPSQVTILCVPSDYNYPGKQPGDSYLIRRLAYQKAIEEGQFTESDCKVSFHWRKRIPQNERDIPLDKHFKPKLNNYIYFYLIECYRIIKPRQNQSLSYHKGRVHSGTKEIAECYKRIERRTKEVENSKQQIIELEKEYVKNNIFEGFAVNRYKTPASIRNPNKKPKLKKPAVPGSAVVDSAPSLVQH
jgi:hypothetical protein